jgi:hypothetical protein
MQRLPNENYYPGMAPDAGKRDSILFTEKNKWSLTHSGKLVRIKNHDVSVTRYRASRPH